MAGTDRAQADDLDWAALAQHLPRAGLFAILRHAEARASGAPRLGRARRPQDSIVDLAQEPSMGFADRSLSQMEMRHGRPQLRGYWLGLTGPMGPLPSHLSEFAYLERRYAKKRPFGDWLDVLAGRMLQLFYRAWAESQPIAHADRANDDGFAMWLGALSGATVGAAGDSAFFARARVHYASVFAGSRSAIAIQDALSHLLMQPVEIQEYIPKWRAFEEEDRSLLGRNFATLGSDAVLGRRIYSASDAFRVVVRAQDWPGYLSMLPGAQRFAVAAEAVDAFKPTHLEWDLCLEIAESAMPPARLDGRARLGWSACVKRPGGAANTIRADAHLRPSSLNSSRRSTPE